MQDESPIATIVGFLLLAFVGLLIILGLMFGVPMYNVWAKGLAGQATLEEAEFSRQVRVAEAEARLAASKLDAQSAIVRANGQAEANRVVADTLTPSVLQNEYLRMLEEQGVSGDRTVIYIPTDSRTGLPVALPAPESMRLH